MMATIGRIISISASKSRLFSTARHSGGQFSIRQASDKDMNFLTQQAVKEKRNYIGPNDFSNAFAFDQRGFFVGEVDKKLVGHIAVINYPKDHSQIASCILEPEYRRKGYGTQLYNTCYNYCDKNYTIGSDIRIATKSEDWLEGSGGFEAYWSSNITVLNANSVAQKLRQTQFPYQVSLRPLNNNLSSLLEYDTYIYGTPRHSLIKSWLNTPGSYCIAAVKNGDIVGYTILRQVIRGGGTEIGLAMAPLYADNVHIVKSLLKGAAEKCLASDFLPNTKLSMFYPSGKNCGDGASELMEELEVVHDHFAYRMYSKGVPPHRKLSKIYGIGSPMFD